MVKHIIPLHCSGQGEFLSERRLFETTEGVLKTMRIIIYCKSLNVGLH